MPFPCTVLIADSRPLPGPFTYALTFLKPRSKATLAQSCAAICAAYGVFFLEPRSHFPADDQITDRRRLHSYNNIIER